MEIKQNLNQIKTGYPIPIKVDGLTTPDPQAQGGARSTLDPWKDKANDGKTPILKTPQVRELMTSEPMGDMSTRKPADNRDILLRAGAYDPVRDVQPSTPSAPAPAATPTGDPWFDSGDNGREIYPADTEKINPKLRKILPQFQRTRSYPPIAPLNLNSIGSVEEGADENTQELEPAEEPLRKPSELDQHLVINHYVDFNPTLYPVDAVQDLHMELHASGEASDHNPEVLKVANIEHLLGNKEEELNFLPKISELIDFPPQPGEEGSPMFPYSFQEGHERFVESPKIQ